MWAVPIISAANAFDYIVHRVKFGLTSFEELATPLVIIIINNKVLRKIKIAIESGVKNWAYISRR